MSRNDIWLLVFAVLAFAGLFAGVCSFFYYRWLLGRLTRMLCAYQKDGSVQGSGAELQTDTFARERSAETQVWRSAGTRKQQFADTQESKLEAQLRKILRQSAVLQEQARKDREGLAGLLSDLSHQLKTPLANVVMDAELLQEGGLSEEERRNFELHIREQAEKMQWLLSALVKASRLENGIVHFEAVRQDILPTLAQSVSAVYGQAQEKDITIELEEAQGAQISGGCLLYHNRKWTAEAITNILENAVKYSPRGSRIRIVLEPLSIYTKINIFDQGPGVPQEEYHQIFQRFYRGSHMQETEGTGLGLYLAQVILAQEKGYAAVSENPEGGSCFSVFLLNDAAKEKPFLHKTLEKRTAEFDGKLMLDGEYDWGEPAGREVW